ncbi:hypothetical protein [Streptomyces cylindrosporus]|uniref:ABC transporter permease n=1 Tax=Streptomyces cylindrosporus TaxID=2927583 RepID=A0ABS9Y7W0_9ACTN|nr:hypothetical protein [Streptomyces cylindrosporus]MCI3272011.1 hypothetical protein [Streptomyces cylindrosporus]
MTTFALPGLPRTVLRLHRTALIVWGTFVAAVIGWLVWLNTVTADRGEREMAYCEHHETCNILTALNYSERTGYIGTLVCYSFLAVAAWAGAALIGRELESGTAKLAWTQGVTPVRWLTAKLALPALLLTLGGTALVLAFRWGWSAHRDLMGDDWTFADVFVARGPATVAYGLCALAVGTLTALLIRRTLPALGISLAAMWLLNFVLERHRGSFWPTLTRTSATRFDLQNGLWQLTKGHGADGYYVTYHPQSHFWPMHLVETGIVLAVAALATLIAFRLLPRRTV